MADPRLATQSHGVEDRRVLALVARLLEGDKEGGWALLQGALSGEADPGTVYVELLIPALRVIGDGWERGEYSVGQEHVASVAANSLIGRLGPWFVPPTPSRGWIVVGAPPGEEHGMVCSILADLLCNAGFEVVNLGANAPARAFAESAMARSDVRAVLIGATTSWREPAVRQVVLTLRHAGVSAPILVGGHAIANRDQAVALGADQWSGRDAASALAAVEGLLRYPTGDRPGSA